MLDIHPSDRTSYLNMDMDIPRRAAEALLSSDDPAAAARGLFELVSEQLGLDMFISYVVGDGGRTLRLFSAAGISPAQEQSLRTLAFGETACGMVAERRVPLLLNDVPKSSDPAADSLRDLELLAYAGFPMICRGRMLGTLCFGSRRRTCLADHEVKLLATLSSYLSMAMERLELTRMAEQRAAELSKALNDKEKLLQQTNLLLKEVNHRVKNSLQMVVSLLEMQRTRLQDETATRALMEAGARVIALAQVHARLYQGGDVQQVDMDVYLRDLCEELRRSTGDGSRIEARGAPVRVATDLAIPVALIATELVMNSLKHAFLAGDGMIEVSFTTADAEAVLTVADDGCGLPATFDPKRSQGLGMRIVNSLTRQIGGRLSVGHPPRGSSFAVRFPLPASISR